MRYLFIDTASNNLIISIIENDNIVYCYNEINNNETSSKIMPIIDEAFKKSNLKVNDIDKIFVVNGPGSFTGIRVGLTVAKIMSYCLNIPLVAISELELLATTKTSTKYIVPIIDARRGYVYGAIYDDNLNIIFKEQYILLSELEKYYKEDYKVIDSSNDIDIIKVINKHLNDIVNPHELKPNYLKNTEAEEKLND